MAFRQHRPQPARQLSFHIQDPPAESSTHPSPQRKRTLEDSEEWVLFSPGAPSTTRSQSNTTDNTQRTAGLSRVSDFGSLDTAAHSGQIDDDITCQGTVTEEGEELDSLDDGLHAFHEPSEYGVPPARELEESGMTVLPTHDGLGTFQPSLDMQEHLWQFERQNLRRRPLVRRRSSVQRRLDALEEAEEVDHEQERRQRIEKWRIEQSKALLEEIERESRRRRRMSLASTTRSHADSGLREAQNTANSQTATSVSDGQSEHSDDGAEHLSFWQRLTRRVIRDLMGIDEDTLSVIFGEALPGETISSPSEVTNTKPAAERTLQVDDYPGQPWEHRLLERIARELGILVHQLSEHPGAFNTYLRVRETPEYVGLSSIDVNNTTMEPTLAPAVDSHLISVPATSSPTDDTFAPLSFQRSALQPDASLWGIEEESEVNPLDTFKAQQPTSGLTASEESAQEREYWEQELDVRMVFNFLVKRFSSQRSKPPSAPASQTRVLPCRTNSSERVSARRAAIIRQNHPLVNRNADHAPASSLNVRESRRKDLLHRHHVHHFTHQPPHRNQALRSSSSCASHSTKKSKLSNNSGRNFWDLSGSVGSGSALAAEV